MVAQPVKNLPAMQQIRVQFLGWEGLLEKGVATHSSVLAWRIPWTEEPGGLRFMGVAKSQTDLAAKTRPSRRFGSSASSAESAVSSGVHFPVGSLWGVPFLLCVDR